MDDVVVDEGGVRSRRARLRRAVPLVAVAVLATGCYQVEIDPIILAAPPEPGQPVEVCADIGSREASTPGQGEFVGDLVFTWDAAVAPSGAPEDLSVRTVDADSRACAWHVYHHAGTYEVEVAYSADLLAEPGQPGVLPDRTSVDIVAPPDPQPFLIGYPTSPDGDWWFSYRNRWFSASTGQHLQIDPTAQLLPYLWEISDASGAVVLTTSTTGPDLVHRLAPGTYRVQVTAAFEGDGFDEPITATDVRWITAGS